MNIKMLLLSALAVGAVLVGPALAVGQMGQNDIVVGLSDGSNTYRHYDAGTATWSNGPGWSPLYMQGIEYDNANLKSHNAAGNLLANNFGNAYTGFEVHNLETAGGNSSTSLWGIKAATGGTETYRGAGISVSPFNSYFAWTSYDTAHIYVHNYLPGSNPGTGATAGASVTGPRETGMGDGNGNPGYLTALKPGCTQGTTWLNDSKLLAFNGYGEIVQVDMRNHPVGGTEDGTAGGWQPEQMTDWVSKNTEVSFNAQYTDIEYNPEIDKDHIYASVTNAGSYTSTLYRYDYDPAGGTIALETSLNIPNDPNNGDPRETREIAFDSEGNLYWSCYAGSGSDNLVCKFTGATVEANWADASNIATFLIDSQYSSYNGLDVAKSTEIDHLIGDADNDGDIDTDDLLKESTNWDPTGSVFHAYWQGDFDRDGDIDTDDLLKVSTNWNPTGYRDGDLGGSTVPEPTTLLLLILGGAAAIRRRRQR